jgi:UDP-N-acetylmuramate dehydrogenase
MIEIKENFGLYSYNTFRITANAKYFVEVNHEREIAELIQCHAFQNNQHLILGGGSNILFTGNFGGLIIHPRISGIHVVDETERDVLVKVGSGVVWDTFVEYAVTHNWGGIENLSEIPGNTGASPIQNIGAYGTEIKDTVEKVECFNLKSGNLLSFSNGQCEFGYRNSIFKKKYKNDLIIIHVFFRLKKPPHTLITNYDTIQHELRRNKNINIGTLRKIVCDIRRSKLPSVSQTGNAGSFFKNPTVTHEKAEKISSDFKEAPVYNTNNNMIKLSAAWLIEKSGCKGIRCGNVGTYEKQPLVLINLGKATGKEIIDLAKYIQQKVLDKFGIELEPEVNII